jgi:hypothetical protein
LEITATLAVDDLELTVGRFRNGQRSFQSLNRFLALIEGRHRVHIQIHTQTVTQLVGDKFRIVTRLTTETGMRAAQDLKRRPIESDRVQRAVTKNYSTLHNVGSGNAWVPRVPFQLPAAGTNVGVDGTPSINNNW